MEVELRAPNQIIPHLIIRAHDRLHVEPAFVLVGSTADKHGEIREDRRWRRLANGDVHPQTESDRRARIQVEIVDDLPTRGRRRRRIELDARVTAHLVDSVIPEDEYVPLPDGRIEGSALGDLQEPADLEDVGEVCVEEDDKLERNSGDVVVCHDQQVVDG